jgi:hypothetical protein
MDDHKPTSWKRPLLLTLGARVAYSLFAACAALLQPVNWRLMHSNALTENVLSPNLRLRYLMLGAWERFDTLWYLHIAIHGYDRSESIVFFPLYPALIKLLSPAVGPMAGGLLISTAATFFLFWGLEELVREESTTLASQSVILCAVWPGSFIFLAGYPESLLLALIVWSFCLARRDRWSIAVVLGVAAGMTKAIGVVIVVPLLVMAFRHRKEMILVLLAVPIGWLGYLGYLRWSGHEAIGAAYGQYWHTCLASPWTTVGRGVVSLLHAPDPILMLNLVFLLSTCVLAALSQMRLEFQVYAASAVLLMLCKATVPPLQSMIRYTLIIFPAYVGVARLTRGPATRLPFGFICVFLMAMNLALLWLFEGWSLVL